MKSPKSLEGGKAIVAACHVSLESGNPHNPKSGAIINPMSHKLPNLHDHVLHGTIVPSPCLRGTTTTPSILKHPLQISNVQNKRFFCIIMSMSTSGGSEIPKLPYLVLNLMCRDMDKSRERKRKKVKMCHLIHLSLLKFVHDSSSDSLKSGHTLSHKHSTSGLIGDQIMEDSGDIMIIRIRRSMVSNIVFGGGKKVLEVGLDLGARETSLPHDAADTWVIENGDDQLLYFYLDRQQRVLLISVDGASAVVGLGPLEGGKKGVGDRRRWAWAQHRRGGSSREAVEGDVEAEL